MIFQMIWKGDSKSIDLGAGVKAKTWLRTGKPTSAAILQTSGSRPKMLQTRKAMTLKITPCPSAEQF
jgi:hypothetical protein